MALTMAITDSRGVKYTSAYFRVTEVNLNYRERKGRVLIEVYKDQQARKNKKEPVMIESVFFEREGVTDDNGNYVVHSFDSVFGFTNLDGSNPIKAAYEYIRTLPKYSQATDII